MSCVARFHRAARCKRATQDEREFPLMGAIVSREFAKFAAKKSCKRKSRIDSSLLQRIMAQAQLSISPNSLEWESRTKPQRSLRELTWRRFLKHRPAVLGLAVVAIVVLG